MLLSRLGKRKVALPGGARCSTAGVAVASAVGPVVGSPRRLQNQTHRRGSSLDHYHHRAALPACGAIAGKLLGVVLAETPSYILES